MSPLRWVGRNAKRAGILAVGSVVVIVGVALLALPGPGMIVIILGLVILAQEFTWAERLLDIAVEKAAGATTKVQESKSGRLALAASGVAMVLFGVGICIFFSKYLIAGISIILAGLIALCSLHPRVHEWIEERARIGINATDDVG